MKLEETAEPEKRGTRQADGETLTGKNPPAVGW